MSDNINVEVKRKNPSIPPKNLRELTAQVAEIEGTIDDINESVEEAEQDVHEIKTAITNSDDFVIRDNKMKRKNKAYNPAQYSGLGEIYLEKNNTFLGREFDEFVVNVDVPDPTAIAETFDGLVYDRHRKEFLVYELVDGERVYYAEWTKFDKWERTDDYIPEAGYDFICEADDKAYRWTEETTPDLIETEAHYGNVLKQEMVNLSNTIYHIQYDYTLIGKEITIPEGCVLQFEGGSFSNGEILGQNTKIEAGLIEIFNSSIAFDGTWNVVELYPEWFGAKGNGITDDYLSFNKVLSFITLSINSSSVLKLSNKTYKIGQSISLPVRCSIIGCGTRTSQLLFYNNTNGLILPDYIDISGIDLKDFSIYGSYDRSDIGTIDNNNVEDYSIGIVMKTTNYAVIENVKITDFVTGIYMNKAVLNSFSYLYIGFCNVGILSFNGSYHNRLISSTITACLTIGMYIRTTTFQLIGIDIEACATAINIGGASANISDSHFEGSNTSTCINIVDVGKVDIKSCFFGGFKYGIKSSISNCNLFVSNNFFSGVETEFDIPNLVGFIIDRNIATTAQGGGKAIVYNITNNGGTLMQEVYSSNGYISSYNTTIKAKNFKIGNYDVITVLYKGQVSYASEITIPAGSTVTIDVNVPNATLSPYTSIVLANIAYQAEDYQLVVNGNVKRNFDNRLQLRIQNLGNNDISITPTFNIIVF